MSVLINPRIVFKPYIKKRNPIIKKQSIHLSAVEILASKVSFGSLLAATSIYEYKVFFTDDKRNGKMEQTAMTGGNVALASLLATRWAESGHFPLSNMYESLLFLAWGVTSVHLATNQRNTSAVLGAFTAPTALIIVAGATMALPTDLQTATALVPALKSNWLMMHVSVMMMSYATLMVGSLACISFLYIDSINDWNGHIVAKIRNRPKVHGSGFGSEPDPDTIQETLTDVISKEQLMNQMDNLSYSCLTSGFALLTTGLISGAVWANEAWGSYWSWDPKETWALITWLVYATYLHSRLIAGKSKKDVALVGVAGFVVIWICYIGVNLWGVGLHSYGWFNDSAV